MKSTSISMRRKYLVSDSKQGHEKLDGPNGRRGNLRVLADQVEKPVRAYEGKCFSNVHHCADDVAYFKFCNSPVPAHM